MTGHSTPDPFANGELVTGEHGDVAPLRVLVVEDDHDARPAARVITSCRDLGSM